MRRDTLRLVRKLEEVRSQYDTDAASRKLALLSQLKTLSLRTSAQVIRLHESLCFLRAYPDNPDVLSLVESMLEGFDRRSDLMRFRSELADSGVAGTAINFEFFWFTACWLIRHWPDSLTIDWPEFDKQPLLEVLLPRLMPFAESPGLDMLSYTPQEWIDRFRSPDETDAAFLVRRFRKLPGDTLGREVTFESLTLPMTLSPAPGSPSRTLARLKGAPVSFQKGPLQRARPVLQDEIARPPVAVRPLTRAQGQQAINLMREAMVTRHRDLYSFAHADPDDVRMVDCGEGLQFACIGTHPEHRLVLETLYGLLTIKNGVPIGYVLTSSLFGSTELAYNVFESFRGAEAGAVFGRVMAMARHLFSSDAFSIDPYQLGYGNEEGQQSGAWWFYYKLGFRPVSPAILRLAASELARMTRRPAHRTSLATLATLAEGHLFWFSGPARTDVLGQLEIGYIGERVSRYLAGRFGSDRERGLRVCAREAAVALGVRIPTTKGERTAWERWAPIVCILPGVGRWSAKNRRALAALIRAKGGRRESDFVRLFNAHPLLHRSLARLAATRPRH